MSTYPPSWEAHACPPDLDLRKIQPLAAVFFLANSCGGTTVSVNDHLLFQFLLLRQSQSCVLLPIQRKKLHSKDTHDQNHDHEGIIKYTGKDQQGPLVGCIGLIELCPRRRIGRSGPNAKQGRLGTWLHSNKLQE